MSTQCQFLFGSSAKDVFKYVNFEPKKREEGLRVAQVNTAADAEQSAFIESSLLVMRKVVDYIFDKKDVLPILSSRGYSEACIPLSMIIRDIKARGQRSEEESRIIVLSFFLSFAFEEVNLLLRVVKETMAEMQLKPPKPQKKFELFLRDDGKRREQFARVALNRALESYLKEVVFKYSSKPLEGELQKLAHENLMVKSTVIRDLTLYQYPTFAALVLLVERALKAVPLIFKVRVLTEKGMAGTVVKKFGEGEIALVFEGVSTQLSGHKIREEGLLCAHYFRGDKGSKRHKLEESCTLCMKVQDDQLLERVGRDFATVTQSLATLFYALGVDAAGEAFRHFFTDEVNYPCLTKIYREAEPRVAEMGVGMAAPRAFTIFHVHVDTTAQIDRDPFIFTSSQKFLGDRLFT